MTKRVLVVDDHPTNRLKMSMAVRALGLEPETAAGGQEALDKLASADYDLVLLDLMMPEMDGYEVLSAIKADTALRDIPVIVVSAVDELQSVARAIKLGAEDYLPKSFDPIILEARVGACLEKKRLHDLETQYLREIEAQKTRADAILHLTLPAAVVHELKTTNQVKPRRFEDVAVLFCDVVGFTGYCDTHAPEEIINHLDELVFEFEKIVERNGLEKIKTIGDAFLATAGLFKYSPDPVVSAIRCGLEMTEAAPRFASGWQVHVGVHAGAVIAGVVGRQQYMFDIWGDTVNTAARISDQAAPGKVLVSGAAWRKVGNRIAGVSKGITELKGKGKIELIECRNMRTP